MADPAQQIQVHKHTGALQKSIPEWHASYFLLINMK